MYKIKELTPLQQLSRDLYNGCVEKYSVGDAEAKIKEKLDEVTGGDYSWRSIQGNKQFFAIIEELVSHEVVTIAAEDFPWVEFKNFNLGDKPEFKIDNPDLFDISVVSTGVNRARRQRLIGDRVETKAFNLNCSIYEEFFRFRKGEINWTKMIDNVAKSFKAQLASQISFAIQEAHKGLHDNMKISATYTDKDLMKLIAKVGGKPTIYGTPQALSNIEGATAVADLNDKREYGYVKLFNGCPCVELPQMYHIDEDEFEVRDDLLYIVKGTEPMVRVGFEGDALVIENTDPSKRQDRQIEMYFEQMVHIAATVGKKSFAAYEIV